MARPYAQLSLNEIDQERARKRIIARRLYAADQVAGRAKSRAKNHRRRDEALRAYGAVCACCGEGRREFLTIDHIAGNGAAHRRALWGDSRKGSGSPFYGWLKRQGYPEGFRVLCQNCNCAMGYYGYCPHAQDAAVGQ